MQTINTHQDTTSLANHLINRYQGQCAQEVSPDKIRIAVRAWAASINNQDVVTALIVKEWEQQGGCELDFPADLSRQRQKLFRWLDSSSPTAQANIRLLTPVILAVLPLEFRGRLAPEDNFMARLASMEKEISEAKQVVMLDAPRHQKLKEMSEGIVSMFRVDPDLAGPLMAMVTTMLNAM